MNIFAANLSPGLMSETMMMFSSITREPKAFTFLATMSEVKHLPVLNPALIFSYTPVTPEARYHCGACAA